MEGAIWEATLLEVGSQLLDGTSQADRPRDTYGLCWSIPPLGKSLLAQELLRPLAWNVILVGLLTPQRQIKQRALSVSQETVNTVKWLSIQRFFVPFSSDLSQVRQTEDVPIRRLREHVLQKCCVDRCRRIFLTCMDVIMYQGGIVFDFVMQRELSEVDSESSE